MKITFLGLGAEQLGVSQLSAISKQLGHECNLAFSAQLFHDRANLEIPAIAPFFDDTKDVYEAIRRQQPDVIAFGALTSTYQWGLKVAEYAKNLNPNIKVVLGGVHPSAVPDLVMKRPQVDYIVTGEGEVAFPDILDSIQKNDLVTPIVNTRFRGIDGQIIRGKQEGFFQDLDSLPFYDKMLWEDHIRMGDLYMTLATRGCPYRCSFCFNNFFAKLPDDKKSGKYVRIRSVDHLIAELKFAKKRYKLRYVDFEDDVFGTSKKWLHEFAEKYKKEINVPFQILTHPKFMDDEVAKLLSSAGLEWVQMGVQSMDEEYKKESLLRYEKSDDISAALQSMHKYGIRAKVDHMFGLPNEPITAQENALKLYTTHHLYRINTFWTCYLPGTDMMKEAIADGRLSKEHADKINEGIDFYFFHVSENVKDSKLVKLYAAYEVIFRIMPILPGWIKKRIKPNHLSYIPKFILRPLSMIADLATGFSFRNPEFYAYLMHNLFHLYRFFAYKIGFKNIKPNKIKTDETLPHLIMEKPNGIKKFINEEVYN